MLTLEQKTFKKKKIFRSLFCIFGYLEAVAQRCFLKKVFLEISQNPQENTCARISFLIKLQARGLQLY